MVCLRQAEVNQEFTTGVTKSFDCHSERSEESLRIKTKG
jgi:hypothetical protein